MRAQLKRAMPGRICRSSPFSLRYAKVLTEKTYTRSYTLIGRYSEKLESKAQIPVEFLEFLALFKV